MNLNKKKLAVIAAGIIIGLLTGFLYWKFIGCASGTCPLTSNWYTSTFIGGLLGYLVADSFTTKLNANKS